MHPPDNLEKLSSIEITPSGAFSARLRPPGSKSLTNRALLLAALSKGTSRLNGVLFADDTRRMLEALSNLGLKLEIDEPGRLVAVHGAGGKIPVETASLNLGNAGTAMRSLTAVCCLGKGVYKLDGIARMRQRPIGALVDDLRRLGAKITYLGKEGFPPLTIADGDISGGHLDMKPSLSSQFISAVLMIGPLLKNGLELQFDAPIISLPYVQMTVQMIERFGGRVEADENWQKITVQGAAAGGYQAQNIDIEPDASNASYFLAAAAIVPGSRCTVEGLGTSSIQGDSHFAHVLEKMGAQVEQGADSTTVAAPKSNKQLIGIDIDLNKMPDMAQTLAAVALFAKGSTTIRNIGNLRVKETDRLAALQNELTKLGATVVIAGDDITINPPAQIKSASLATYDDHRMAMSMAIVGLRAKGIVIEDPKCVNKTFPGFFDCLQGLGK